MKAAFLGLGTMGYRMAARLAAAGVAVTVYNRSAEVAQRWRQEHGGEIAATPAAAAAEASVVLACLSDDAAVRDVALGANGAFQRMRPGSVFVDHSTASATLARELADAARGQGFDSLDAPVTGGKPGAEKGSLTIMVGGDAAALERARPCMSHYAKQIAHMGPSGAGQVVKMANQICIAGIVQSMAEAFALVEQEGLDAQQVLQVLQNGSGRSWQMENRGPNMLSGKYDFGFAAEWLAKDLGICMEQARRSGLDLRITPVVEDALRTLVKQGFGQEDVGALLRLVR